MDTERGVVRLRVVNSLMDPGQVSLRTMDRRSVEGIKALLTRAGFQAGDIVEIRVVSTDGQPGHPAIAAERKGF